MSQVILITGLLSCGRLSKDQEYWAAVHTDYHRDLGKDIAEAMEEINKDTELPGHEIPDTFQSKMTHKGWKMYPLCNNPADGEYDQLVNLDH